MSNTTPTRFDFSHTELVGHLDLVGECISRMVKGEPMPYEVVISAMTVLRSVRDDLASKGNLPVQSLITSPAYLAECEIRNLTAAGAFDRNTPISE